MPSNTAAWITAQHAPLQVGMAPYPVPAADQIVVRNRAIAVNPVDWIIQVAGRFAYRWLTFPTVLGSDVSGEVVALGSGVTRFRIGDRVLGHAVGTDKDSNNPAEGAFQEYTLVLERMASPIPPSLSFEDAAVLPLAVSTAACGLFGTDQLHLRRPCAHPEPTGETVLVWGGATSVGCNAIQLAVAAGYDVIATTSPHNFAFAKSLGAAAVFDYHSTDVITDLIAAFKGRILAGAIAFGTTSADGCVRVVAQCEGNKFVSLATPPVTFADLGESDRGRFATAGVLSRLVATNIALQLRARPRRIRSQYIWGSALKDNDLSLAIYRDFLPSALAEGRYAVVPPAQTIGDGLEFLQEALDTQRKGVSAKKIVITLPAQTN